MIVWIEVDLPPKALSPNAAGSHWRARHQAEKTYKQQCAYRFACVGPLPPPITVHLEFYLGRGQATFDRVARRDRYFPKDEDNARSSFKRGQDALIVAGVIPNDSIKYLHAGRIVLFTQAKDHGGRACVMVGLEYEPPRLP